jgi:hypothetical protein
MEDPLSPAEEYIFSRISKILEQTLEFLDP